MTREQKNFRKRILELSFEHRLPHLGSCLSAIDLIDAIFEVKKSDERFILSNGHAGVALYVILEKHGLMPNLSKLKKIPVHPDRNTKIGLDVSTGSLGMGISIAVGIALAQRDKNVYCMISDGECAEGVVWESFRVAAENKLTNLKIILNANGWGAYDPIDLDSLLSKLHAFGLKTVEVNGHRKSAVLNALKRRHNKPLLIFAKTLVEQLPFLKGQDAHYYIMKKEEYNQAVKTLV